LCRRVRSEPENRGSLQAQEQQARFALAATHITLSANVAAGAIQEASLRGQIAATQELITINTNMLKILREQYAKGYTSELDVAAQESQLAQVAATLPPLLSSWRNNGIFWLCCRRISNQDLAEKFELSSLQLPQELPVSLPSTRRAASGCPPGEENLHSASAQIGIARANRLPSFALTADAGSMAVVFGGCSQEAPASGMSPQASPAHFDAVPHASGARRASRLYAGRRTVSQYSPNRVPECC